MSRARDIADSASTINALDGVTATGTELNILDALTRGSIIYGNSSGATAELTKGTADQVLTSDGTDISWADAGGGGTWEVVQTYSPASPATVTDIEAMSSSYDTYMIVVHDLEVTGNADLQLYLKVDGAYKSSNYTWYRDRFYQGGTYDFASNNNQSVIDAGQGRYISGYLYINNRNRSSNYFPNVEWNLQSNTYASSMSWSWGRAVYTGTMTSRVTEGLRIRHGGSQINTGSLTLYGLKKS